MRFRSLEDVPADLEQRHPGSRWVVWAPKPRGPKWLVRVDVGQSSDESLGDCIGIELRSFRESADGGWPDFLPLWNESPSALQRRTLRDVPLGQILTDLGEELEEAMLHLAQLFRADGLEPSEDDAEFQALADGIEQRVSQRRVRGPRKGRGVPDLSAIAEVYLKAKAQRKPTTRAVAAWGQVSDSTAAKWIMRVRQETKLLPAPANRAGARAPKGGK